MDLFVLAAIPVAVFIGVCVGRVGRSATTAPAVTPEEPTPTPGYRTSAKPNSPVATIETVTEPKFKFRKYVQPRGTNPYMAPSEMYLAERTESGKQWVSEHGVYWYAVDTGVQASHDLNTEIASMFKVAQLLEKMKKSKVAGEPIGGA